MKKRNLNKFILLLVILCLSVETFGQNLPKELQPDDNFEAYLEKSYVLNKNAAYLDLTSIYGHNSIFFGYQRYLIKGFWTEIGLGLGIGNYRTKTEKDNVVAELFRPIRFMLSDKIDGIPDVRDYDDPYFFATTPQLSYEAGIYKKIVGLPLTGQWSLGVKTRFVTYDVEYNFEGDNGIGQISSQNVMKRSSIYGAIAYKMYMRRNLGLDYTFGVGNASIKFEETNNPNDPFNNLKYNRVDYFGSLKLYYTF